MRTRQRIAGLLLLGAAACVLTAGPAAPANAAASVAGEQIINAYGDNKCAAVPGGVGTVGLRLVAFVCAPENPDKRWYVSMLGPDHYGNNIYTFKNVKTGLCMTASGGGTVTQNTCNGAAVQKWSWDKGFRLHNNGSGDCLAVPTGDDRDGVRLQHRTCDEWYEQKWSAFD